MYQIQVCTTQPKCTRVHSLRPSHAKDIRHNLCYRHHLCSKAPPNCAVVCLTRHPAFASQGTLPDPPPPTTTLAPLSMHSRQARMHWRVRGLQSQRMHAMPVWQPGNYAQLLAMPRRINPRAVKAARLPATTPGPGLGHLPLSETSPSSVQLIAQSQVSTAPAVVPTEPTPHWRLSQPAQPLKGSGELRPLSS